MSSRLSLSCRKRRSPRPDVLRALQPHDDGDRTLAAMLFEVVEFLRVDDGRKYPGDVELLDRIRSGPRRRRAVFCCCGFMDASSYGLLVMIDDAVKQYFRRRWWQCGHVGPIIGQANTRR